MRDVVGSVGMDLDEIKRRVRGRMPDPTVRSRHSEWSVISSADDLYQRDTTDLVRVLLRAADAATNLRLDDIASRYADPTTASWVNLWPGEHYRLLAGLTATLRPRLAIEIGTFEGPGALAMLAGCPDTRVVTYDIVPWRDFPTGILRESDFGPQLEQRIGDLTDAAYLEQQIDTLREADVIFCDGPKDGVFEQRFAAAVLPRLTDRPRLVMFDDIRVMNMVQLWRDLPYPKLDATSLGHWSGTGLVSPG